MPTQYFDYNNWMYAYATFQDIDGVIANTTVACTVNFGYPDSAEVYEFDETFNSTANLELPLWETNYASKKDDQDFDLSYDIPSYGLIDSINSKMKQGCVAQVEIAPEEAEFFFNKTYTVVLGGRIYDNNTSGEHVSLPEATFSYFIPIANFTFEELDDVIKDVQQVDTKEYIMDASTVFTNTTGEVKQRLVPEFETNPYDASTSDRMNFNFEFEAPTVNMTKGKIVYQYVTYTKTGNFTAKPITVGCATKVGDPFVTKINTFEGFTGMSETSTAVANKTWDKQNTSEKAKKKESFGMSQESVYYNKYEVGT